METSILYRGSIGVILGLSGFLNSYHNHSLEQWGVSIRSRVEKQTVQVLQVERLCVRDYIGVI